MGTISHPPTSSELLDHALGHQAPHLVKVLVRALDLVEEFGELAPDFTGPDDLLRQLAAAIDRRVYVAKKHHDQAIADVLDDAASRIRARYTAERETLERLDEASAGDALDVVPEGSGHLAELDAAAAVEGYDPTPQRDHSLVEGIAASIDERLTGELLGNAEDLAVSGG